ncbi:DUF1559 domain-containing protein [Aeoliella sp.]|uniref:DUF1559 family PulG-like putative transporter n=1 Tax=Aeoliella sp. TaxID=2795800 RepID=UPI003CCB8FBC
MLRHHALKCALIVFSVVVCQHSFANERVKAAVEQLAGDDLLVAAAVELDGRWVTGVQQELAKRLGEEGNAITGSPAFAMTLGFIESFRSAGAREVVVVLGAGDLNPKAGPIVAITTESPDQGQRVRQLLEGLRAMMPGGPDLAVSQQESLVLVGQKPTVERYAGRERSGPVAAAGQLAALLNDANQAAEEHSPALALVVAPGEEPRRVIRELWPTLPKPFNKITGEMLADEMNHVAVRVTCPPEWKLHVTADTTSEHTAETLEKTIQAAWNLAARKVKENEASNSGWPAVQIVERAASVLTPTRNGSVLEITASHDDPEIVELTAAVILPPIHAAREAARRSTRLNNLKQMALAMFNFESSHDHFPAATAIVDKRGKPLLSWRVALLPYLENSNLYEQFHCDEPWDSPHNLTLLDQMPGVYKDDSHPELAAAGKTTYVVPVHPQSAFPPADGKAVEKTDKYAGQDIYLVPGIELRDMTDGTSNTLMIVQVPPEQAVPWTKPADWEVDLAKALQQLQAAGMQEVLVAFCDGSARVLSLDNERDRANLPKMITRDGKETVEY